MKPKRRSTFSPASAETTLKSPRSKRKRLGTPSPTRRKSSNSSEEVKPPPEFIPFSYERHCPKLGELLEKNTEDIILDRDDLLCLQHELESMLAHSADYLRRAHGEVTYLNTGDYPVQDLKTRLCSLPEDDTEDDVDIWPPHHIPQRFWTWCKADFLTPIDAEYLKNFKTLLLDKYTPEELKYYYVNEPWKHRKRQSGRSRISSQESLSSRATRRLSSDAHLTEKRSKEKEEKSQTSNRKISGTLNVRPTRSSDSKLAPLISDVVCAATREMSKEDFTTPNRRSSIKLHSRDDCEDDRKFHVKNEPWESTGHDSSVGELHGALHVNGFATRSPPTTRMHSPRVKKESREDDEDWDRPGPSDSFSGCTPTNGRCNGELRTRPRRNGETKRENGVHAPCNLSSPASSAMSSLPEEMEVERHYREIGSRIVKMLIERGLIPSSTEHVYREIATNALLREVTLSREGKEDDDDSDLDEVSEELLRCQMELQELEPRLRGVISHCWSKIRGEFAYWETSKQLDDADTDVYRARNITTPSVAAPEFEDRNEQDEGGKGEEDPDAHADEAANAVPPVDDETAGEGIAKEDTEPVKGKDKEENQLGAMVEDAKGNVPVPPTPNKLQTRVDFNQSEDSHFMTFVMVGGLLVFCLYLLHYNKKKILGLVFEGRAPGRHRRNVRYRRLSQRDEHDREDVIY
ncbi:unnamed protein product [Haemonchus placei]|uniref:Rho-GAP domain-containing protein n=1 Tax=Haemonchus placei TaxID=6290 RepID=A0A158QP72_HAEPC|nr:unnamed protein product [Haemonchus placei]